MVQVGDILPLALTLVVAGIGIGFGLNVMGETKTDLCAPAIGSTPKGTYDATSDRCENATGGDYNVTQTAALNASKDTITGVAKFSSKMGIIATVIVAAIVIGLLVRFLFVR